MGSSEYGAKFKGRRKYGNTKVPLQNDWTSDNVKVERQI